MTFLEKIEKARKLIKESVEKYSKVAVGSSFGKDSMVTLHLCLEIAPDIPVFAVMANTEFPETYTFTKRVTNEWHLNYTEYRFEQESDLGAECCSEPKVEKTKEAVKDLDAWISGARNTENEIRKDFKYVEENSGLVKVNPILDFTELDIWRYTSLYRLPVNPKYLEGYRSLGCKYCSTPEECEKESERAGRWRGTRKAGKDCGIHTQSLK